MSSYWIEFGVGVLYLVLGPGAWAAFAFAMVKGRKRMQLLFRPHPPLPQPAPTVSILVPAKDEAQQIGHCIASILRLDYPSFDVIAIDDRSSDGTARILDDLAAREKRVKAVHIRPGELPGGWGGKSHALHRGVQHARGQWLLFVDADVRLEPDVLSAALASAVERRFQLISLVPRFILETFWERLLQPLAGTATGAMFAIALTNSVRNPTAFANGQFMLVRRDVYEQTGGHEAIRGTLSEDTAIARNVKRAGYRPRIGWGDGFATVRMYDSFSSICRGWGRNFFVGNRGKPWRIFAGAAFVILCCFSLYAAIAWGIYRNIHPLDATGGWGWLAAAALHGLIMTAAVRQMYVWSGVSGGHALLFPLGSAVMLGIFVRSLIICITGKVEWRGTAYSRQTLRASSPLLPPSAAPAEQAPRTGEVP